MGTKRIIYQCADPQILIARLLNEFEIQAKLVVVGHSPNTYGIDIALNEVWSLKALLGKSYDQLAVIETLDDEDLTQVWAQPSPADESLFTTLFGDQANMDEIDTGADIESAYPPAIPMFQLANMQPQLKEIPLQEIRELFITLTSDYFMEGVRRELKEALQEQEAVSTICNTFPTLAHESMVALRVVDGEELLLKEQLRTTAQQLHDQQVRVGHKDNQLVFEFLVKQKSFHLICQRKTEPFLCTMGSAKIVVLPPEIHGATVGFVARQAFGDAIELLKAHLEET